MNDKKGDAIRGKHFFLIFCIWVAYALIGWYIINLDVMPDYTDGKALDVWTFATVLRTIELVISIIM
jgi:hypothetical protein